MKRTNLRLILLFLVAILVGPNAEAKNAAQGGSQGINLSISTDQVNDEAKKIPVRGYYRKNGTYVKPHTRNVKGKGTYKATARKHKKSSGMSTRKVASATSKTKRDPAQKNKFRKTHPCPSTGRTKGRCPGYEVDHIIPLACGGSDSPSNMQWLTKEANRHKGAMGCRSH